jgi:chromosomal replication initiation ATPase DnaA
MQVEINNNKISWNSRQELKDIINKLNTYLKEKINDTINIDIQNIVVSLAAGYFQVHPDIIYSAVRNSNIVRMRAFLSYYFFEIGYNPSEIGKFLKIDRTSVLNYFKNFFYKYSHEEYQKFKTYIDGNKQI